MCPSIGPLVRWSIGPLVHWSVGLSVRWSIGPLARWSVGALVYPSVLCLKVDLSKTSAQSGISMRLVFPFKTFKTFGTDEHSRIVGLTGIPESGK